MNKKRVIVIGGGPAGFMAGIVAAKTAQVVIAEKNIPLKTILWTGNGRCNLTNNIPGFKELASHYPRGEKFLYSVFSRFGVKETLEFFNFRGLNTYVQEDNRIFPQSDRAATVRELLLEEAKNLGVKIIKSSLSDAPVKDYDAIIISTGGKNFEMARKLGHKIIPAQPSLTSLIPEEQWPKGLAGVATKNVQVTAIHNRKKISELTGDLIFTHQGLSGPVILDTSAYCASIKPPYNLKINFAPDFDINELETNKSVSNTLKNYIPRSLAVILLAENRINPDKPASKLNEKEKQLILKMTQETEVKIVSSSKKEAMVTAGGVDVNEINAKTMESKLIKGVYFCGEVLNIDGLCGGFNLQMCWSTGYIAGINAGCTE